MKVEIIVKEGFEIFTRSRNNKENARAHQSAAVRYNVEWNEMQTYSHTHSTMYNQAGVVWFDGDG